MSIYLKDDAKSVDLNQIKNSLISSEFVKDLKYISKDEAVSIMKTEFGEDFIDELGYNPLINSFDINLLSEYVDGKKIDSISKLLAKNNNFIDDIQYDKDLVSMMNANLKKITLWMFPITFILFVISVLIINSSIKLAIYSNRWTIKTMQLVGATKRLLSILNTMDLERKR
jgi:cell division transport system permease protein